jgi:hypothetical protein
MKLTIREDSVNYACTVVEIKETFPIEGADRIQRAVVNGNDVVCSKDVKVGDKMLYFCSGTQLNQDYCHKNNLFDKAEENYDKDKKGFLNSKRLVRAIKLKGIISNGMLMPLESLNPFIDNVNNFKVGDEFTDINGNTLCNKYFVPVRNSNVGGKAPKQPKKISRLVDNMFYLHNDTENLRRHIHKLNPRDIIGIHYKKHGCQATFANIPVKKNLKWYEKLAKKLGLNIVENEYDIVYSSRKVVKNSYLNTKSGAGFYGEDVWGVVAKEIGHLIPKNWTLYGEIIGYTPNGSFIQKDYDYSCQVGEHKLYIYKISVVNPDGSVIYLTDKQIGEWCNKVGLLYSDTFLYYGRAIDKYNYNDSDGWNEDTWREKFLSTLENMYNEKDCYMCSNKVPEEGIILRIEKLESYEAYKLKSKRFILGESLLQEQGETNLEDNQ